MAKLRIEGNRMVGDGPSLRDLLRQGAPGDVKSPSMAAVWRAARVEAGCAWTRPLRARDLALLKRAAREMNGAKVAAWVLAHCVLRWADFVRACGGRGPTEPDVGYWSRYLDQAVGFVSGCRVDGADEGPEVRPGELEPMELPPRR